MYSKYVRLSCLLLLLFSILPVHASLANTRVATERTYAWLPYFIAPCQAYNVPIALALAIARQESGTRPWLINIEGQSLFPQSAHEARAIAEKAWQEKRSFDVGIMQINSYWLKKYHIPIEEVLDPQKNIAMGVWILAKEIQRYGLSWQAVGAYHTPLARNPERAKNYALNVIAHMRAICDKDSSLRMQAQNTHNAQSTAATKP